MVGVPRSKGCPTCIKRRVKCDERRPGCGNCEKYGVSCIGYEKKLKFVNEKNQSKPHHQASSVPASGGELLVLDSFYSAQSRAVAGSLGISLLALAQDVQGTATFDRAIAPAEFNALASSPSSGSTESTLDEETSTDDSAEGFLELSQPTNLLPILLSLRTPARPFVHSMLERLFEIHPQHEVTLLAPWFTSVLDHLGEKTLLDTAMCAFTMHLVGKARRNDVEIQQSKALYGQALRALQRSLNHPTECKTLETLCSTMILCIFELFAGTAHATSWMAHAAGVATLIQHRGPEAFQTPLESALLLAFRPIIVIRSLFVAKVCFLSKPRWAALLNRLTNDNKYSSGLNSRDFRGAYPTTTVVSTPNTTNGMKYANGHFSLLARLPALLQRDEVLREQRNRGGRMNAEDTDALLMDASELLSQCITWFEDFDQSFPSPTEVPSQDPNSPFPTVLAYPHPWLGSLRMGHWSQRILLQEIINLCNGNTMYRLENEMLAVEILRSVETVGMGMMGPYRIANSMRIAYEFVDLRLQEWVQGLLERLETSFAAVGRSTYPKPKAGGYDK